MFVILAHQVEWEWLRFLTSEAVLRISPYLGMATERASFDTIVVQGRLCRIVIACTFVDVFMGAIPLVWNLKKSVLGNFSTIAVSAVGLFVLNILRLEIGQLLYTCGAPRILADGILSGVAYFAIWIAIVSWFSRNWGKVGADHLSVAHRARLLGAGDARRFAVLTLCSLVAVFRECPTPPPRIMPAAGIYTCPRTVTISDANRSSTIYYTTDNSAPTTASTVYTGQVALNRTGTVRAVALAPGAILSKVVSAEYKCTTDNLTRAEFAALLDERFRLPKPTRLIAFPDVHATDPIYGSVEAAASFMNPQVLCPGCQLNANFFPGEPITRAISTIALVRLLEANHKLELVNPADSERLLSKVSDAQDLPQAARPYFATAIRFGILLLTPENRIAAIQAQTRADIVGVLDRVQKQFQISADTSR